VGTYYRALILEACPGRDVGEFGAVAEFRLGKWHHALPDMPGDPHPFDDHDLKDRAVASRVLDDLDAHGYHRRALLTPERAILAVEGSEIPRGDLAFPALLASLHALIRAGLPALVLIAADQ